MATSRVHFPSLRQKIHTPKETNATWQINTQKSAVIKISMVAGTKNPPLSLYSLMLAALLAPQTPSPGSRKPSHLTGGQRSAP